MTSDEMNLREATSEDIPILTLHHRKMFEEILQSKGMSMDAGAGDAMESAYRAKLSGELASGECKSWVIEMEKAIVASGAISIVKMVPTPFDISCRMAYVHSMYTEKEQRGCGCASRIVRQAIEYCKGHGIKRMFLNASDAGRPVYEKIGFIPSPESMRILL
jgi:GNAT superfamily N-acetyltransferase